MKYLRGSLLVVGAISLFIGSALLFSAVTGIDPTGIIVRLGM